MQRLTPLQARQKIKYYCAYQERSHQEVKNKLYAFGLYKNDVEEIISELITEDYLNEERFARLFVGSKFRAKQWGKNKILHALKLKNVSAYNIKIAMKEIDVEEYENTLQNLCTKKWKELKQEQFIVRTVKTRNFLVQRGFEYDMIGKAIAKLREK